LVGEANRRYGRVDILVNSGHGRHKTMVQDMPDEAGLDAMAANLHSAFYCSRAVIPSMVERRWETHHQHLLARGGRRHTLGRVPAWRPMPSTPRRRRG